MAVDSKSGMPLSWHIIFDPQHLKKTKEGYVNTEAPVGNVAQVIHPGYITNGGAVKSDAEQYVKELCAVCRIEHDREEFGIFNKDGICLNCGASKKGNGPRIVSYEKILEILEKEIQISSGETFSSSTGATPTINGSDGLPRKVYIRDKVLAEANVLQGKHYSSLEYKEIKDWDAFGGKPEGVGEQKCKYLKLIGFKNSPVSIEEIQKLINNPFILVVEG